MSDEQLKPSFIEAYADTQLRLAVGQLIVDNLLNAYNQLGNVNNTPAVTEPNDVSALRLNLAIEQTLHEATKITAAEKEKLAMTDPLTGLPNRRSLEDRFKSVWGGYERQLYPTAGSVLLIDIDNFGDFNTNHGHEGGDIVLKSLAEVVSKHTRPTDIFGRLAGDEFVVIFPGLTEGDAKKAANKLVGRVRSETMATFSGGVAAIKSNNFGESLARADNALYLAKDKGRNQAATYKEYERHEQRKQLLKKRSEKQSTVL